LKHNKETTTSEEIRSDRSVSELVKVGIGAGGGVDTEFYLGELWAWICAAMMGTAVSGTSSAEAAIVAAAQTISGDFSDAVHGAKLIRVSGAANAANNGVKTIISYDSNTDTYTCAPGSFTVDEEFSATIVYNYVRNGTTLKSYFIQKYGVTIPTFFHLLGMCLDSYTLSMEAKKKIMQSFGFLGYGGEVPIDSGGTTDVEPGTGSILTGSNNIGLIYVDGADIAAPVRKLDFAIKNNLRERGALARQGTLLPGAGSADFTGSLEVYFDEESLLTAFMDHDSVSLLASMVDAGLNRFSLFLPSITFADGNWNAQGLNTDIMLPMTFRAVKDATLGYQCQLDYVTAS
jgi:hypothetical protein